MSSADKIFLFRVVFGLTQVAAFAGVADSD